MTNRQEPYRKRAHAQVREQTGKAELERKRAERRAKVSEMVRMKSELIADLRDQCVGEAHTSGLTDKQIHERGGPCPSTLAKWRSKETRLPQLATARMLLRAVGKDLAVVDYTVERMKDGQAPRQSRRAA